MKCLGMNGWQAMRCPAVGGTRFCLMHSGKAAELASRGGRAAEPMRALELADIEFRLEEMEAQLNYADQAISNVRAQD